MSAHILVVDHDHLLVQLLEKAFARSGHQVAAVDDPAEGMSLLDEKPFDLVITDLKMPDFDGIKVLERVKSLDETIEVILLTDAEEGMLENAIGALRLGASDFLLKPLRSLDELMVAVERALERRKLALNVRALARSLEEMRSTDFLTGVCTRRYFFERLSVELLRTKRYPKPVSCLLVDIDHLGHINGSYGSPCGDQALVHVARVLLQNTRKTDFIGRCGGEQFMIALPETPPDRALQAAEKVRKAVEAHQFSFGGRSIPVTVSIGVAGSEGVTTMGELVGQSTQALEEAKGAGRNCVRLLPARVSS